MAVSSPPPVRPARQRWVVLDQPPSGWRRFSPLAAWAVLGAAVAYVLTFNPTQPGPLGPCTWHLMFGVDGPTCGGTRMFYYLIHGNLIQAARHHLAALVGLLYGLYALVAWTGGWLLGKRIRLWRPGRWTIAISVVAFLLYAVVLRNLPWTPFDWFYVADPTLGR
jgi:hypothetical protein